MAVLLMVTAPKETAHPGSAVDVPVIATLLPVINGALVAVYRTPYPLVVEPFKVTVDFVLIIAE